ncbi:MAG: single-stranded DNA-binding protein [Actinobacteria bacterium]|nr:single-stranded DNA-binding protein [Actinomycetota bacterium]
MTKDIVKSTGTSPAEMLNSALTSGVDIEKLSKILELQMKFEENEARKAYHRAMSAFKENPPTIDKDKKVGYATGKGGVAYNHASLFNVIDKITKGLADHGLSMSWRFEQNGKITVTCRITHQMGHYEETSLTADADTSGAKNPIQAIGSTLSYLQRYTSLALTGLATQDQDDDAQSVKKVIDQNKVELLRKALADIKSDEKKFAEYMGVETLEDIPADQFLKAKVAVDARKQAVKSDNK